MVTIIAPSRDAAVNLPRHLRAEPAQRDADNPWARPSGFIGRLGVARAHKTQIGADRQLEEVRPQKPRREKQHLQVFDLAGVGV